VTRWPAQNYQGIFVLLVSDRFGRAGRLLTEALEDAREERRRLGACRKRLTCSSLRRLAWSTHER